MKSFSKFLMVIALPTITIPVISLASCSAKSHHLSIIGDERISIDNKTLVKNQDFMATLSSSIQGATIEIKSIFWDNYQFIDKTTYSFNQSTGKLIIDKNNFINLQQSLNIRCQLNIPSVNFEIITTQSIEYEQPQTIPMMEEYNLHCWIKPERVLAGWEYLQIEYFKMGKRLLIEGQDFSFQWDLNSHSGNIKIFKNVINDNLSLKLYATKK